MGGSGAARAQVGGQEVTPMLYTRLRDAGTTAGIATDKLLALLGETGGVPVHLNLQVTGELLHERYAQLVREIEGMA